MIKAIWAPVMRILHVHVTIISKINIIITFIIGI